MTTLKGRELDAAVATQVMGWTDIHMTGVAIVPEPPFGRAPDGYKTLRGFSSDIAAAFQVVEKMAEVGFVVQLENGLDGTWECTFHKGRELLNSTVRSFYAPAETLPEAICLAALEAKQSQ